MPELTLVDMTGFTRNAVVHNGVLDPGVNFLQKPFTSDQLASKVRGVLGAPPGQAFSHQGRCLGRLQAPLSRTRGAPPKGGADRGSGIRRRMT